MSKSGDFICRGAYCVGQRAAEIRAGRAPVRPHCDGAGQNMRPTDQLLDP